MRTAGSIILGVFGAILYFAVEADLAGISLPTVGVILMVAAVVWFVVELIQGVTGNETVASETVRRSDGSVEQREEVVQNPTAR